MEIFIPILPPGINETYAISGKRMYKTKKAVIWETGAALIIGSKAAELGWQDDSEHYEIDIKFSNWRQDVDAPIKLIIDAVTRKLGFDDKRILKQCSEKIKSEVDGIWITISRI